MDCGYLLEPPYQGHSNEQAQAMLGAKMRKIVQIFQLKNDFPTAMKASNILHICYPIV